MSEIFVLFLLSVTTEAHDSNLATVRLVLEDQPFPNSWQVHTKKKSERFTQLLEIFQKSSVIYFGIN